MSRANWIAVLSIIATLFLCVVGYAIRRLDTAESRIEQHEGLPAHAKSEAQHVALGNRVDSITRDVERVDATLAVVARKLGKVEAGIDELLRRTPQ